jgi:glyoxylase-like metal-dependent hydrolase (beta-lactamase superfamily II)
MGRTVWCTPVGGIKALTVHLEVMKIDFALLSKTIPLSEYAIRSGFPAEEVRTSLHDHPGNNYSSQITLDYIPLEGGETFEIDAYRLDTVATSGRTNGPISLYERDRKLFLSVNHVPGHITPNIQARFDDQDPFATDEAIVRLRYIERKGLIQREKIDGQVLYSSDGASRP